MTLTYPGVRLLLMVVGLGFGLINGAQAAGAGRAFPINSENYVTKEFQRINPNLEWDRTNFLIDLSGQYANCALISRGRVEVSRKTPEDDSIGGYNDYTDGRDSDVNAVNGYLKRVIDRWVDDKVLNNQIVKAKRFGCSVRPGCNGEVVAISCLFSPAATDGRPATAATTTNAPPPDPNIQPEPHNALARAFTAEQYREAELTTGNTWDRSHYLENLSGFETSCDMIGYAHWPFTKAKTLAPDLHFTGIYGHAKNEGSTQVALAIILKNFKKMSSGSEVGCSLIPDCRLSNGSMFVVVSCIFQDY